MSSTTACGTSTIPSSMERKKHKRLNDTIMKPEDLKKSRGMQGPSTSGTTGGIKAKLNFGPSGTGIPPKPTLNSSVNPSQSSHHVRPFLDDKWKEFGETIILNLETFEKSVEEAVSANNFQKVARLFVAALKSFVTGDKLKIELRIMATISATVKIHGSKLNHIPLHRGLLFILCHSKSYPENVLELLITIITSLLEQQQILDKCYITAFLNDSIGMNVGIGTINRCSWIENKFSRELVARIMSPFGTCFPDPEMYTNCQVENFPMSEFIIFFRQVIGANGRQSRLDTGPRSEEDKNQIEVYLEFLKPWFDTIRGEVLPKPLFRALCLLCGSEHVRFFIANRLEIWITLQKFHREISELLLVLGTNINAKNYELDRDVIDILLKLNTKNMKTRTVVGPFTAALKRICEIPANAEIVLESLFINETGPPQNRSPTNLQTIYMLLSSHPIETTRALARITSKELFKERDNSIKMLRAFLRELIRGFYHSRPIGDFPFSIFAETMFQEVKKRGEADEIPVLVCDLVSQIPLATISSLLLSRDTAFSNKYNNPSESTGESPLIPPEARIARTNFQTEYITYSEKVIEFLAESKRIFFDEHTHIRSFSLLLFLETQRELYTMVEMAAVTESEINNCVKIFGECGISEKMILLICREETQLPQKSLLELVSALTQRAAIYHPLHSTPHQPLVQFTSPFKLIDALLKMTIYPKSEYTRQTPVLCHKKFFWTAWNSILLWVGAGTEICPFFKEIYDGYAILRYIIQCILTRKYQFPQAFEGKSAAEMAKQDALTIVNEAKVFKQFVGEVPSPKDSLIFPKKNEFRAPVLLEEIRVYAEKFNLASRFARCTSPPLLFLLISTVGAQNSLFAVREMLSSDAKTAGILTSECVFHALMFYFDSQRNRDIEHNSKDVIKALIREAELNLKSKEPIEKDFLLNSFVSSLASPKISVRNAAVNTFSKLFPSDSEEKPFDIIQLAKVPRFESKKLKYMETMASAVLVESNTHLANAYIQFLTVNGFESTDDHTLARAVCRALTIDCLPLHTSLCEYFLQYVDMCTEIHKVTDVKSLDASLCCVDFGNHKVALSREVPIAVIKLLAKYDNNKKKNNLPFETLVQIWLTPGSIPKIVDRKTGVMRRLLSLQMRKEMLKSVEQRVVDAALEDLSEKDAQEFVLVSRMSRETAEKVIKKAENMSIKGIQRPTLSNMYILIRGYRMLGVESGESLVNRVKEELDRLDTVISKEETMEVDMELLSNDIPLEFLCSYQSSENHSVFSNMKTGKMEPSDITNWLKINCAPANAKSMSKDSKLTFHLPSIFIQSSMNEEKCSLACLSYIEANLKYFLSHESAFQTLIVIIDSAANRFDFVRKRLETFAVKILKSVSPPGSVLGILQKHAANCIKITQKGVKKSVETASTFAEFAASIRKIAISDNREIKEKRLVDDFMATFMEDKGEVVDSEDVNVFIRSIRNVYFGGNPETTAERCLSNRWSPQLRKIVCTSILERYKPELCPIFVFRLMASYCKKFPIASYSEMFTVRKDDKFVLNRNSFKTSVLYFCDVALKTDEYDLPIVNLIAAFEKQGSTQTGFYFGQALLQTSCANTKPIIRRTAKRLLETMGDRLLYLQYKSGVASSMRILTNVESRESCIRRCEQIVDRLVEMPLDPNAALSEDICEEDRQTKEVASTSKESRSDDNDRDQKYNGKRGLDSRRGGPPAKKGRYITAKDLPGPLGTTSEAAEESTSTEDQTQAAVKREWIATSHAMTRFVSLLREHPNIVKMKFPVLANYVSRVNAMSRKELREEKRISKVELILQSVVALCQHMKPEEMSSVDTALSNCLEFYEKHLDEGGYGIKEQTAFAELTIRACAEYLNHSFIEARTFLRDNRQLVERVCKRCHDRYNVEMVLDNCQPISI
ncbi:hypothetical protein GCK72_001086 [Caenorhabditis remanei]|uniref:Integrator complex subunit 1 RPB2-binding domain-containing protein n=1 Tax=Caenorhabditis remanei TaxID=31234 RepID=A0A6A5HM35_CAERE|nr:hypothetical protein GCK72_001086 [Caenorhabditis remanei]KAF1769270.1 hypothetical protein GCK72_001086 [Caenorhabditis remanei]